MNSGGGISYTEAYHMPITYRTFNIKKISKIIEERNKRESGNSETSMQDLVKKEAFVPDFVTKRAATK